MDASKIISRFLPLCFFLMLFYNVNAQKIGLLMDSYVNERWLVDQKLFSNRIAQLGGEVQVEVANGDASEQFYQAQKLISEGANVLVVVPVDARKAIKIVELAKKAKVPVISYDRLIMSDDVSLYVSYNNRKVGQLQAEYALRKKSKGSYLLLNGPTSDNNAIMFRKSQMEVLQNGIDKHEINILSDIILDSWSEIEALMKLEEYFLLNESIPDVIIAANDALANAAIESLKSKSVAKDVVITGQDADVVALRNILAGKQSMTIYKPIKPLAFYAAEAALKLAKGEKIEDHEKMVSDGITVNSVLLNPIVVDNSNYKETVVRDGHLFLSEILNK